MLYRGYYDSPIGVLTIVADEHAILGLWIKEQKYYEASLPKSLEIREEDNPMILQTKDWLTRYFNGEKPEIGELNLAPQGSEFRQMVWKHLLEIPYGQSSTYGAIAKALAAQMGKEHMSAQAVGGAVGHNPIGILIPCHRVLGADGSLTGYAGGLDAKISLLNLEKICFRPMKK